VQTSIFNPKLPRKAQDRLIWGGLSLEALALALSQAMAQQPPLMVITPDSLTAQNLEQTLRFFYSGDAPILHFPDWETLPYDGFSPHQDIVSQRLSTLYRLLQMQHGIVLVSIATAMQVLPPIDYVQANSLCLKQGQTLSPTLLRQQLTHSGYRCVNQVTEHGEFAVRGSLLDVFPMGAQKPYRIDWFGDDIDSLRPFDVDSQRSLPAIAKIELLPAREFPMTAKAIRLFQKQWLAQFNQPPQPCSIYQEVSQGLAQAGIEYYLPLFFAQTHTLFDYFPNNSVLIGVEQVVVAAQDFLTSVKQRYQQLSHDISRSILPPDKLFLSVEQFFQHFNRYPRILSRQAEQPSKAGQVIFACQTLPDFREARHKQPLAKISQFIQEFSGRVLFCAESLGRREALLNWLGKHQIQPQLCDGWADFLSKNSRLNIAVTPLQQGVILGDAAIALIPENLLLGQKVSQHRRREKNSSQQADAVALLTDLEIGVPVVHEQHGVGRYLGLSLLTVGNQPAEFLHLGYANGDKLYVPVGALHLISRFTGADAEHAPLHRLGSDQWEKAKKKAQQRIVDVAAELLAIYAKRAARQGFQFRHESQDYEDFAQQFPFEETPDQQAAIDAVLADMRASKVMDRLICGDVGFGKTEVAMRAVFVAVQNQKQVAVLVPTTLLAEQHDQTFSDRFAEWPVTIGQLSRFRSAKEQKQTLADLAEGKLDIVIGTHKLLQKDIKFKDLGLVVIDEEHRFGVRQKEQFKALRAQVDILTLTATPIPRSLNMALADLRDLSIIASPPSKRLAIKTFVHEWDVALIAEALLRELKRGGQVYFLHNDVASIAQMADEVAQWVPEAKVQIAHGQMPERQLEQVMQDFYHRRANVLVCTTIIETGIDIPTANTIIINRADKLGLAQLYQLRGRVGRSHHKAYAYLIIPRAKLGKDAIKRLEAIAELEELGMGFTLASHDLEIRGAGELLGDEQSGHIQQIGYTLYHELLARAIDDLKHGKQPDLDRPLDHGAEILVQIPALLPQAYIFDVHTRLSLYKRIASASHQAALDDLQVELIDRFGLLPDAAKNLFAIAELKLQATPLGIVKIELAEQGGRVIFIDQPPIDPMKIIHLIKTQLRIYRFDGKNTLHIHQALPTPNDRLGFLAQFLTYLR